MFIENGRLLSDVLADTERLDYLVQECAEVIQAVQKLKQFGPKSYHPDAANEILHFLGSIPIRSRKFSTSFLFRISHKSVTIHQALDEC